MKDFEFDLHGWLEHMSVGHNCVKLWEDPTPLGPYERVYIASVLGAIALLILFAVILRLPPF
jgi:hypothetical protein